jgi:hypothetical protein
MLMNATARAVLGALTLAALAASASAQSRGESVASILPPGPGRDTIATICTGCHPINRLSLDRKTPAQWRDTVLQMVSNGAQLFPEEIDSVTHYLVINMGKTDK